MNHFYVLRNNREAGPFTRAELTAYGLLSTDLLWVDGESKEWKHPADIDGLAISFSDEIKRQSPVVMKEPSSLASTREPSIQPSVSVEEVSVMPVYPQSSYHHTDTPVFHKKKNNAAVYTVGAHLFGVVVVLIGLALCGFVVINMLKQFSARPATTSEAVLLNAETLPASNTAHTAEGPQTQTAMSAAHTEIRRDSLLSEATTQKQLKLLADAKAAKAKAKLINKTPEKIQTVAATAVDETPPAELPEEKTEPAKPAVPPALQLSANDYKVGLFGGVSNLEITVANPSGQNLSKAVVEIEFLKPNGNVVKTQIVTAENIAAGASKTIPVPSSGRGVKVRYHVVSTE